MAVLQEYGLINNLQFFSFYNNLTLFDNKAITQFEFIWQFVE